MSDDPMDGMPAANRLSLRAVLVAEGEDATAALAQAGLIDAVKLPAVLGDIVALSGGILGDGLTPNVTAVLETEQQEEWNSSPDMPPGSATSQAAAAQPSRAATTTTLPAAYGMQPLAPVRSRGA